MAGHTFIARIKVFFQRLFRKPVKEAPANEAPVKGQKIPLHILDGVCCGLSPTDRRVQDYLNRLVLKGEYKRPSSLASYRLEEEEEQAMKEEDYSKMLKQQYPSARVRRLWRYNADGSVYVKYKPKYEIPSEVHGGLNRWVGQ